jgi:hypothetical protein
VARLPAPLVGPAGALVDRLWRLGRPRSPHPGAPPVGTAGLARRLDVVLGERPDAFRQQSATTCGSSTLAMFRVLTDPAFAAALLDGGADDVARRWAVLERSVQTSTNRALRAAPGARPRPPWPLALGTPPWGLRDALDDLGRDRGVRFQVLRVDGGDPADVEQAVGCVRATVARGIPVPLYVGNRLLPRHVVLAVAAGPSWVDVYDPGTGRRHRVERAALVQARARISGWDRLWAVVVPR